MNRQQRRQAARQAARGNGQPAHPPPPQTAVQPVTGVKVGALPRTEGIFTGDPPCVVFQFDIAGEELPAVLLPIEDVETIERLAGGMVSAAQEALDQRGALDEVAALERGSCRGCGQPIFGDLVDAGYCRACDG